VIWRNCIIGNLGSGENCIIGNSGRGKESWQQDTATKVVPLESSLNVDRE
jgi:hypothetical protein